MRDYCYCHHLELNNEACVKSVVLCFNVNTRGAEVLQIQGVTVQNPMKTAILKVLLNEILPGKVVVVMMMIYLVRHMYHGEKDCDRRQ